MRKSRITILGARGSIPVSGTGYVIYGGATSCVLLEAATEIGTETLIFDAGSGLMNLPQRVWQESARIHIFLSHYHLDHIMGIPMSPMMYRDGVEVIFYAEDAQKTERALHQIMAEPIWPVGTDCFRAGITYCSVGQQPVKLGTGGVTVAAMPVGHPGGALAFRADWMDKRMVYATDCELDEAGEDRLCHFAEDAQLMIMDAQYTEAEGERCKGFGHTDMRMAAELITKSGAERGLLFHHAPLHTDEELGRYERQIQRYRKNISFAREGDIITL